MVHLISLSPYKLLWLADSVFSSGEILSFLKLKQMIHSAQVSLRGHLYIIGEILSRISPLLTILGKVLIMLMILHIISEDFLWRGVF